jgi:hypothetical protein
VVAVVEKAMQADRDARYAHATEMLAALKNVLDGAPELRQEMLVAISEQQKAVVMKNSVVDTKADTVVQSPRKTPETGVEAKAPWWRRLLGR